MPTPSLSVVDRVSAAMSVSSLQHQVVANNIANRDTQGYQRIKLQFDRALGETGGARIIPDTTAAPVSIEQDLVSLSSNATRYEALARVLSRYFSIAATIVSSTRG
jgi:flagellar basal body rod protein FlgB